MYTSPIDRKFINSDLNFKVRNYLPTYPYEMGWIDQLII